MQDQLIESYEEQQFPAFPVVFQNQIQHNNNNRISSFSEINSFKKYPQKQLTHLRQMLDSLPKYDTKYSILWTNELSKLKIQQFLSHIYQPFNQDFINEIKKQLHDINICRIGEHKVSIGKIKNNLFSGNYIIIFKNGTIYQGQMVQNKRHGRGSYFDANIGLFKGYFNNDIKQGEGIEILQNKTIYQGSFMNSLRHGPNGYYADLQQNQYFGDWKLGIMHGKGFLKTKNSIYYGMLVNWLKHGQGQQKFANGDYYKGQYQNGRFDGFGTYKWANSAVYQGSFKNGFRHGKGKWSQNETKYLGNYVQGLKEGYGQLYFPSGNFYKGNFLNDKREGYGQMFWTDGSFYKGEWKDCTQNGKGQIYLSGNEIMSGIFENSILIQISPSTVEKQVQDMDTETDSEPRGIIGSKNRTYSEKKVLNSKKKLAKIDESIKKPPQYSVVKQKMLFRSPQRSGNSLSQGKQNKIRYFTGHAHDSSHGHSRQCKCVRRLQNFRLKQQMRSSKIQQSRFNN